MSEIERLSEYNLTRHEKFVAHAKGRGHDHVAFTVNEADLLLATARRERQQPFREQAHVQMIETLRVALLEARAEKSRALAIEEAARAVMICITSRSDWVRPCGWDALTAALAAPSATDKGET